MDKQMPSFNTELLVGKESLLTFDIHFWRFNS